MADLTDLSQSGKISVITPHLFVSYLFLAAENLLHCLLSKAERLKYTANSLVSFLYGKKSLYAIDLHSINQWESAHTALI